LPWETKVEIDNNGKERTFQQYRAPATPEEKKAEWDEFKQNFFKTRPTWMHEENNIYWQDKSSKDFEDRGVLDLARMVAEQFPTHRVVISAG